MLVVGLLLFVCLVPNSPRPRQNKKQVIEDRIKEANKILYTKPQKATKEQ